MFVHGSSYFLARNLFHNQLLGAAAVAADISSLHGSTFTLSRVTGDGLLLTMSSRIFRMNYAKKHHHLYRAPQKALAAAAVAVDISSLHSSTFTLSRVTGDGLLLTMSSRIFRMNYAKKQHHSMAGKFVEDIISYHIKLRRILIFDIKCNSSGFYSCYLAMFILASEAATVLCVHIV
ncbi:hypothetical protein DY000_02049506 [Brassica cretica]|uniref:Uncharacterized protein n=1 Tax=Brassica cretica TaxID=69181 RepID=A0ABQ7EXJ6_BRACR|nr:hypothetical protein DY000_02049506 [Brassica cretica]